MLEQVILQFVALLGFAALVSVAINILKLAGVVKDGDSAKWVAGFNLAGVIALYVVSYFKLPVDVGAIDKTLLEVATLAGLILSYVSTLLVSKLTYVATKELPVIGATFSPKLPEPIITPWREGPDLPEDKPL